METRSGLGVLVTPEARHQGVILMRHQRTTLRAPIACAVCGRDTTWAETASGKRARNLTCSPACRQARGRRARFLRELRRIWGPIEITDSCWMWTGQVTAEGYAYVYADRHHQRAYRVIYQAIVGPIPDGLSLDHLCHNADVACPGGVACPHRRCVNPEHLEPCTIPENYLRAYQRWRASPDRQWCINGHEMTPENTYVKPDRAQKRVCRTCTNEAQRRSLARRRVAQGAD